MAPGRDRQSREIPFRAQATATRAAPASDDGPCDLTGGFWRDYGDAGVSATQRREFPAGTTGAIASGTSARAAKAARRSARLSA